MVSYKDIYEGRLPYALSLNHVEDSSRSSYESVFTYLKNCLLDVALSVRVIFKKNS